MPIVTVTLPSASTPGQSAPVNLAWGAPGAPISVALYPSPTGASTGVFTIQYTLDDLQLVNGSSNAFWANLSSAIGQPGTVYNASTTTDGVFYSLLSPVAAVRINSSALSSGTLVMKVLQSDL